MKLWRLLQKGNKKKQSEKCKLLIVGLGNPGKKHENTRHNLGFMIVQAFAEKKHWKFKKMHALSGKLAKGEEAEKRVYLLLPSTYMNLSGQAVQKTLKFFAISSSHLLVVSDDVALPFGKFRFRNGGSSGGHKGLQSIETCIGTKNYNRLRIGIGEREEGALDAFVLSPFTKKEQEKLPEIIISGMDFLTTWIHEKESI